MESEEIIYLRYSGFPKFKLMKKTMSITKETDQLKNILLGNHSDSKMSPNISPIKISAVAIKED